VTPDHLLASVLATHDPPIELLALLIAREADPSVDVEEWLRHLDDLAGPLVEQRLQGAPPEAAARALTDHVYGTCGFRGDDRTYYDPANSYLDQVIRRRAGIPITLAVILIAVGRRAGIKVEGIGFPTHFLARVGGYGGVYVDPFDGGKLLEHADLEALVQRVLGTGAQLDPRFLEPSDARAMTVRMLGNLKLVHRRRGDHARAMLACDRLVDLTEGLEHRRDRGLHAMALGAHEAAAEDLAAYLEARPDARDAAIVRGALERARGSVGRRPS